MRIIGLAGSDSKSRGTVASIFRRKFGIPTIDVARASQIVTEKGSQAYIQIVHIWGDDCVAPDGSLDKEYLLNTIGANEEHANSLRHIISSFATRIIEDGLRELEEDGHKIVIVNYGPVPHSQYDEQIIIGSASVGEQRAGDHFIQDVSEDNITWVWEQIKRAQ